MPPTRGHDLKLFNLGEAAAEVVMPPTRGHDLKLAKIANERLTGDGCPPHGGTT